MKEYSKPLIDVVREAAEGVYATSGGVVGGTVTGGIECESDAMKGVWQPYDTTPWAPGEQRTYKQQYGCTGCPAHRGGENGGPKGCGLLIDQAKLDGATSYEADKGDLRPDWEYEHPENGYIVW